MTIRRIGGTRPQNFSPTVMFHPETPVDEQAVRLMYSLYADVAETMDTERGRQTRIGISEIGTECSKCLARKLSEDQVKDPNWKAQVGTFIHAGLEDAFTRKYVLGGPVVPPGVKLDDVQQPQPTDEEPRFHLEQRVIPYRRRMADGTEFVLPGSCDIYVEGATYGVVGDWKTQGLEKLRTKTSKGDIGATYNVQRHTYGLGWEQQGKLVTHVAVMALPRDGDLVEAKFVLARYDRQVAIDSLARLDRMLTVRDMLESAYPGEGWRMLIDQQPTASGCLDCPRYQRRDSREAFAWMDGPT